MTRLALSHVRAAPDSKPRLRGERAWMFADRAGLEDLIAKALASTAVAELRAEMVRRNGPLPRSGSGSSSI
jgi:hypothetical protein